MIGDNLEVTIIVSMMLLIVYPSGFLVLDLWHKPR
jgi:hypothetical protein